MTAAALSPLIKQKFFDNNGNVLASGKLFTYSAGTTTPVATYADSTGSTPNTNPVILNARGEADVWLLPNVGYKFILQDSLGNGIYTEDNVFSSQLISLFGGTDTGSANVYLLNFAAPFTSYANGTVIYFVPANTNTGASTVNVNGLGVVPIVNIDGSAVSAGQIQAGVMTQIIYYNGSFQLLSVGTFNGITVGTFGQEVPIASAATTDLGTAPAHNVLVTGSTTITSFGTTASLSAPIYVMRFSGSLTLTYNMTSMILPGGGSIVTQPGDAAFAEYLGSGNWKVLVYQSNGGQQLSKVKPADTARASTTTLVADPDLVSNMLALGKYSFELYMIFDSAAAAAGFKFTNVGTAIDSRGTVPNLTQGIVNAAAVASVASFYGATVTYATISTGNASNIVLCKGSLLVGTAGTFGISWAQNASNASATTLRQGSYLTLVLLNTGSNANSLQHVYSGTSGTETIPTGYTTCVAEVFGGTGGGGGGYNGGGGNTSGGGGGGSGGYARTTYSVTTQGGNTLTYVAGAAVAAAVNGMASSVSPGTATGFAAMTGPGGAAGGIATGLGMGGTAGAAGATGTGGTSLNSTGNAGGAGANNAGGGIGGVGGFGVSGVNYGGNKGGNGGSGTAVAAQPGNAGLVVFTYT